MLLSFNVLGKDCDGDENSLSRLTSGGSGIATRIVPYTGALERHSMPPCKLPGRHPTLRRHCGRRDLRSEFQRSQPGGHDRLVASFEHQITLALLDEMNRVSVHQVFEPPACNGREPGFAKSFLRALGSAARALCTQQVGRRVVQQSFV